MCFFSIGGRSAIGAEKRVGRRPVGQPGRESWIRHDTGRADGPGVSDETDTRFGGDAQALTTKVMVAQKRLLD